jgi:hypothetical protein
VQISDNGHLTYCTNIHPGETWPAVFGSLVQALQVREQLLWTKPFGIGLRLSAKASRQLNEAPALAAFQDWLREKSCYVFTMNGFPYGPFHGKMVKDQVHAPDWTTRERVDYTIELFDLLAALLPGHLPEGGVSTSPLSYRWWHKTEKAKREVKKIGARHLAEVTAHLVDLKTRTGKSLHLDIEPEPDGLLENSTEFLEFYEQDLLPIGSVALRQKLGCTAVEAADHLREHVQLCYDVCHFAVEYEDNATTVLRKLENLGVRTGKIQISAALQTDINSNAKDIQKALEPYDESTYLHQTVCRQPDGGLVKYPDLGPALKALPGESFTELRTHFHVPVFTDTYGKLRSTNRHIGDLLAQWKKRPFCPHLEVETYTWDVLPDNNQLGLTESIARELQWVRKQLEL